MNGKILACSFGLLAAASAFAGNIVAPGTQQSPAGSVIALPGLSAVLGNTTGGTIASPVTLSLSTGLANAVAPGGSLAALAVTTVNAAGQTIISLNNVTISTATGPVTVDIEINQTTGQVTLKPSDSAATAS